jgi:phospholipid/cholesterol/gamma-HCH transport system ATP-binding protein
MEQPEINKKEVAISIKNLSKSFGDLNILKDINLEVYKGENVALLGKSGSGKSVLIKLIAALLKPTNGEITVLGQNVNQINNVELNKLRLKIGFSFQSSALYDSMNIYENLAFPLKMNVKNLSTNDAKLAVEEALTEVGLIDKIKQMPSDLSGGQRKRIGIARTLIMKPEIMLYDEPTSGLDPITSKEINNLIIDVQKKYKTSAIIITHDLTCARNTGNRTAVLIEGKILKAGTFEEVFNSENEQIKSFYNYNFIQ